MSLLDLLTSRSPSAGAAVTARTNYELKDFVGDQQGVDDMTTSTATMLHNADTITLTNPFQDTVAHFTVKTVNTWKKKLLSGNVGVKTETKVQNFNLSPGQTRSVRVDEGEATFLGTGETLNQDKYVTLVSVDTKEGTQFTGAGQPIFGPGGYWNPQNIISRVRGRRMVIGESGRGVILTPAERTEITDLTKGGEVISPRQLAMMRAAYLFDDVRGKVTDMSRAQQGTRGSDRVSAGIVGRYRHY